MRGIRSPIRLWLRVLALVLIHSGLCVDGLKITVPSKAKLSATLTSTLLCKGSGLEIVSGNTVVAPYTGVVITTPWMYGP